MTFIDTNVFVYLIDDRNLAKQKSARFFLRRQKRMDAMSLFLKI